MNMAKKRTLYVLITHLVALLILTACDVTSENPVDIPQGTEIDPAAYLGNWNLLEVAGEIPQQSVVLAITQVGTNIAATYSDGESASALTGRLTEINSEVIACLQDGSGPWTFSKVVLGANSNQMVVTDLSRQRLRQDVDAGLIAAKIYYLDTNSYSVGITADSASIRSYLSASTNLFYTNGMVFVR